MGVTYNSDTVIVNVRNLVELFFQLSVLSLWPMQQVSVSNRMLQNGLASPRITSVAQQQLKTYSTPLG